MLAFIHYVLLDLAPKIQRIGYLIDAYVVKNRSPTFESAKRVASRLRVQPVFAEVSKPDEFEAAFVRFRRHNVEGLVVLPSAWFNPERARIAEVALRHRLPAVAPGPDGAEAGALLGYGYDRSYNFRRAAWYVDPILKGVKPGDLPIEQPSKFELVVNLKTARALGITVPR